jgi:acyl-ACP thioesterase
MDSVWETKIKIRAFDVDANNRLKVNTILDYFQDAASNDAERLKFGYADFVPMGLFWVLSWLKLEVSNFPKFMDEIKIQTWGKKQHKLYSIRDYLLLDSDNNIFCKGTSAWILLDSKTMKPKILTQLFPEFNLLTTQDALTDLPQKIILTNPPKQVYTTTVRYSGIDLNRHTNNSKYIEMMIDCYDEEFHNLHKLKSLTVSFNSESKFGDQLQLSLGTESSTPLIHNLEAKNISTGKSIFSAMIEWNTD